jgi:hypothetical protein
MTKLCNFCQKETVYVPLSINPKYKFEVHYCYDCAAEFVDKPAAVHLYKEINNRMYRWSVEEVGNMARIWYVGEPGVPGRRPNRKMRLVKSFKENFPQVNPKNIERKLRFMLLFL